MLSAYINITLRGVEMGIFMKWDKSIVPVGKLPLRFLFVIGFAVGFLIVYWGKGTFLKNMGMLDEDTLYHMKYMAVDNKVLFWYVLCKRGKDFIALVLMATTYLGLLFCGGMTVKYGFSLGLFLGTATCRYGIKGILLCIVGIFPHCLCYVPAMVMLLQWCEDIYRSIYFYHNITGQGKKSLPGKLGKPMLILGVLVLGCVLEAFVNPVLFKGFLQFF